MKRMGSAEQLAEKERSKMPNLTGRGYASAAQGVGTRGGAGSSKIVKKGAGEEAVRTKEVSWVPDPKTGFYKPENSKEIDMAELRASLLNRKLNNN